MVEEKQLKKNLSLKEITVVGVLSFYMLLLKEKKKSYHSTYNLYYRCLKHFSLSMGPTLIF